MPRPVVVATLIRAKTMVQTKIRRKGPRNASSEKILTKLAKPTFTLKPGSSFVPSGIS
ncbi:hypothetical protein D3C72_1714060 [compost metagenome]